jgi:two-component system nitrogen regulation sensor histidine kinase GlnL
VSSVSQQKPGYVQIGQQDQILDALATAVILLDTDLRIVSLNPASETLLQASIERARGLHFDRLANLSQDWQNLLIQVQSENFATVKREMPLVLHSGAQYCVDLIISPLQPAGESPSLLLELNPVDRLNAISEDAQLREAQASMRQVIKGLAHEVKNPLGGIRGAAQLLARELGNGKLTEYTDVIMEEVDRLRTLVDRMLGPRERLLTRLMNIHEVLERVRQLTEAESGGKVVIERDYDPSLPEFKADPDQLTQVILNITRNASQAMSGEGTITLRSRAKRQYTLGGKRHKLVCCIDIVDAGPGIPNEQLHQLFLPMVTSSTKGNGLGLSIAQMIANRHGGLIQCDSEPGHTCFTVLLPMET